MLVFAAITPHPPIILPEIGGLELAKVKKTVNAMKKLAKIFKESKPEKVVIISPHPPPQHGAQVPLYYLMKNLPDLPIEELSITFDSYKDHYQWGKKEGKKYQHGPKRIAFVASGDLSHCLKADGPYGFNPAGPLFDRKLIELIKKKNIEGILNLDRDLIENAGECGLRSICFLFGVLEGQTYEPEILSYEGPFSVGYLVANFKIRRQIGPF
jgi:aromatic ring-opening dioxygenase LigB subunit